MGAKASSGIGGSGLGSGRGLLSIGFAVLALIACSSSAPTLGIGPQGPQDLSLQKADLPKGLDRCPGSGAIAEYLQALKTKNPDAYTQVQDGWKTLQDSGAQDAAITSFTDNPRSCEGALDPSAGQTATTFVIQYRNGSAAGSAWQRGILGFPTPADGQVLEGLTKGSGTGLGKNSWQFARATGAAALYVAYWQHGSFDVFLLTSDLDPDVSNRIARAVDSRIH